MPQRHKYELGFVRCAVTGNGTAKERLIEAALAATHGCSAAHLSGEPECEFSTRVFFVEQIDGGLNRGDRSEKVAEQLVSSEHADLCPVIDQSALATPGTLEKDLRDDRGQLRGLMLVTEAHGQSIDRSPTAETAFAS